MQKGKLSASKWFITAELLQSYMHYFTLYDFVAR